jgi:hypothetical protein
MPLSSKTWQPPRESKSTAFARNPDEGDGRRLQVYRLKIVAVRKDRRRRNGLDAINRLRSRIFSTSASFWAKGSAASRLRDSRLLLVCVSQLHRIRYSTICQVFWNWEINFLQLDREKICGNSVASIRKRAFAREKKINVRFGVRRSGSPYFDLIRFSSPLRVGNPPVS